MKREVKVRGRDVVLYLLRQKKKLVREERDSGGHTVYIFELDDDDLKAVQEFAAQPLVILEGSYSHHPLLAGYETLRVFVTCSREEQTRRLQAREGERYANFAARWIPLEEGYFAQYRIEETTDLAVDTTAANACAGMMCR